MYVENYPQRGKCVLCGWMTAIREEEWKGAIIVFI